MSTRFISPQETCDKILAEIRASNLHFMIQESPYSIYLTLRKKYTKNASKHSKIQITTLENHLNQSDEKLELEEDLKKKDTALTESKEIIKILEEKVEKAECDLYKEAKSFKNRNDALLNEIKLLKESIKKSRDIESDQKADLMEEKKNLKAKEKEVHNLQKKLEISSSKLQTLNEKYSSLKSEKNLSDKNIKILEKKFKNDKEKFEKKLQSLEVSSPSEERTHGLSVPNLGFKLIVTSPETLPKFPPPKTIDNIPPVGPIASSYFNSQTLPATNICNSPLTIPVSPEINCTTTSALPENMNSSISTSASMSSSSSATRTNPIMAETNNNTPFLPTIETLDPGSQCTPCTPTRCTPLPRTLEIEIKEDLKEVLEGFMTSIRLREERLLKRMDDAMDDLVKPM